MSETAARRLLQNDSRTENVSAQAPVTLTAHGAEALLRTLGTGETVLALYQEGPGFAALTDCALILLGGGSAPLSRRVPRPLVILRPVDAGQGRVDVSVEGRRISLWGSPLDKTGELLRRAGEPVPGPTADDPRIATAAAGESISLSDDAKRVLLGALGRDEVVRSIYHDGWGHAALTGNGLILVRNLLRPRATRVPRPLLILRSGYGMFDSVEVLVAGKPHKLHGSKLDPKGALLGMTGALLPSDSPLRPDPVTRFSTWARRHPVLVTVAVAGLFFAGVNSGSAREEAVAEDRPEQSLVVPDFEEASLISAVSEARVHPWLRVSAADASSAHRAVKTDELGWRVCFQSPSHAETVNPSETKLTLYAVPEQEECPALLYGPRRVVMPDLVGERLDDATRALGDLGLDHVDRFHMRTGEQLDDEPRDLADWRVCRQRPEPEVQVSATSRVDLWMIVPGSACVEPSPTPKPKPEPKPEPKPKPKPKPRPEPSYDSTSAGGSTGGGSSSTTGSTSGGSTSGGSTGGGSTGGGSTSGGSISGSGGSTGSGSGVQFGQSCSPVGATTATFDGRPAKCFMGKDGRARWGYNSG